ncbi:MAG: biotin--[acetyl-CoA-carboxylase] ligase [Burkholderiaceae bacterium]
MSGLANRWRLPELRSLLAAVRTDCALECVAAIDSTNAELMRRLRAGDVTRTALVAEQQSAGRGRLGRAWHGSAAAAPGQLPGSLTFSLSAPLLSTSWSGLSLALGLAVAQSLHAGIRLKWPNDLWWQDRKLAGILIETVNVGEGRHAVIGVGINIAPRGAEGLATAPACMQEILPELDAAATLQRVLPALLLVLGRFEAAGLAPFMAGYRERDALRGRRIELSDGTQGRAAGVDAGGALLVHTSTGMLTISSSEVSVRPLSMPRHPTDGPLSP